MKIRTILGLLLLLIPLMFVQCGSKNPEVTPETPEEAQKIILQQQAEVAKKADKIKKKAIKEHLKKQTRPVRKSIKRNAKKQKKRMKIIEYRKVGS